ncbi:MAG: hypothetical protein EBY93_05725, partial [Actinobacteria bacterium]|nr:hypothetical protein [Actinomycetota bacterium]
MADILVIAGLSGAGRSQAADDLEDLGWFVVDNLPVSLIDKVVELSESAAAPQNRLALVVGVASHQNDAIASVERLRQAGNRVRILYMDAATPELIRRYGASKRRHPMAIEGETVERSIERERHLLEPVKAAALVAAVMLLLWWLDRCRIGTIWRAVGEDELAAQSAG